MARKDALLRIHKQLMDRRDHLRRMLDRDVADMNINSSGSRDEVDAAFDSGTGEVSSHLAEFESRELAQIEKAIRRLKGGTYGSCEGCDKKINVARLNALPYSTTCMECQRAAERPHAVHNRITGNWEKVYDAFRRINDDSERVDLAAMEKD